MRKFLGVAALLVGCGDPRAPFVGHYKGTFTFAYSGEVGEPDQADFAITAPDRSDRLEFQAPCKFTAKAVDADTIQIDPVSCPPVRSTTRSGAMATYTDNYRAGTGRLSNKTLTISQTGEQAVTDISDGSRSVTLQFSVNVTATQQ